MKKRKLFIGNLDYSVTAGQISRFLGSYGTVRSVKVVEGKGYAFVEMGSEKEAQVIQQTLSESIFEGRKLLIDGVPGSRRPGRKPGQGSPSTSEKGSGTVSKPKENKRSFSDGKKKPNTGYGIRGPGEESYQSSRSHAPRSTRPKQPDPNIIKKSPHTVDKSVVPAGVQGSPEKNISSEAEKKPESHPPRTHKKSKVPFWVVERRSPKSRLYQGK